MAINMSNSLHLNIYYRTTDDTIAVGVTYAGDCIVFFRVFDRNAEIEDLSRLVVFLLGDLNSYSLFSQGEGKERGREMKFFRDSPPESVQRIYFQGSWVGYKGWLMEAVDNKAKEVMDNLNKELDLYVE